MVISLLLMGAVFGLESSFGLTTRLFVLYVFPLILLGITCTRITTSIIGVGVLLVLEAYSLLRFQVSPEALIANLIFEVAVAAAIVALALAARRAYLETEHLATTDNLTGLSNRYAFEYVLNLEIARQRRYGGVFSLALIDLDGFKEVNDAKGHRGGDEALRLVAEVLRAKTRESDSVARLGGDEFVILMPNTASPDGTSVCEGLRSAIATKMAGAGLALTASLGVVSFRHPPASAQDAIVEADQAMYRAKRGGKNRLVAAATSSDPA